MTPPRVLAGISVLEDRTAESRCDEGFVRVRRLLLQNRYEDGSASAPYLCDVVSRRRTDAVALVLYDRPRGKGIRVALRTGVRPPVYLRRAKGLPHEDREHRLLTEIVAGVLEEEDAGAGGVESRAARECHEETGYAVRPEAVRPLGGALFPSPGITDEKVFFRAARASLEGTPRREGDGSPMEEVGEVVLLPLREAIRRCRTGEIPDMKTEVALLRLCDLVGYLPALDRFVEDLPDALRREAEDLPPLLAP